MKNFFKVIMGILMAFFLIGCSVEEIKELSPIHIPTAEEKISEMLLELENFTATAVVSYISNKNINQYEISQVATITGSYRIEVITPEKLAGNITLSNGTYIYQLNKRLGVTNSLNTSENRERTVLLLTNFIPYISSSATITSEDSTTIIHAYISGDNPYLHSQRLTIQNDNLTPISLITYDINDNARIIVEYIEFFYNVSVDDALFSAPN